ncbi:MAG: class I SAM-dependent methyltransferase [Acidobacteriota bacterium]|jgi:hypothetical protein|nr:MAG: hypothetical protein DIU54_08525 [Acidobacteriota bacterium]
MTMQATQDDILEAVSALPQDWHGVGTMLRSVLAAIARHTGGRLVRSAETGTGKTTLLLSHLSERHTVFAVDYGRSLSVTRQSPLLRRERVEFVEGPTQRTLFQYRFTEPLDFVLIDGPHAYPFPQMEYWAFYPHIREGGLLAIDDIHIPTIRHLFDFLCEEPMFELVEVVEATGFFRRTSAPLFDPYSDNWHRQPFNAARFPASTAAPASRTGHDEAAEYRERLLPLIARWRAAGTRVAIFGTGEHTTRLFDMVPELETLSIAGFLDSDPGRRGTTWRRWPVYTPDWAEGHCDVVLCSSFHHELAQMALLDHVNVKVVPSHIRKAA